MPFSDELERDEAIERIDSILRNMHYKIVDLKSWTRDFHDVKLDIAVQRLYNALEEFKWIEANIEYNDSQLEKTNESSN